MKAPFGWSLEHRKGPQVPELIPGGSVAEEMHFTDVLPAFRLSSEVTVHPFYKEGPKTPAPPVVHATSSVWAIPWVLVIFAIALIILVRVWMRRRRLGAPASSAAAPKSEEIPVDA